LSFNFFLQVPLGLIFENENESSGMNAILKQLQKEYVPTYTKEDGETEVCTVCTV